MSLFETQHIYRVSELTKTIKSILEESIISEVWVEGEVSNLSKPFSGHLYFKLKDAESQIDCAIFRPLSDRVKFELEDGISILLKGRLTVYEPRGSYQIIGNRVEPIGIGALQLAFEQLKQRLYEEGLFDPEHKKLLPFMPKNIGVITSATGAAIRDILTIISRRYSNVRILLHPVSVQGDLAPGEISEAIKTMNKIGGLDVLIVGRGGGSIEDLWAFNTEIVARSIYNSEIPIISAVGHETDLTIADFVADYRAPTPSAAAEIIVPNKVDLIKALDSLKTRLYVNIESLVERNRSQLLRSQSSLRSASIHNRVRSLQQNIDYITQGFYDILKNKISKGRHDLSERKLRLLYSSLPARIPSQRAKLTEKQQRLISGTKDIIKAKRERLNVAMVTLNALNPLSILQDGYSITSEYKTKKPIKSIYDTFIKDEIEVTLKDGSLICEVKKILKNNGS